MLALTQMKFLPQQVKMVSLAYIFVATTLSVMIRFGTVPGQPKELKLEVLNETAISLSWAPPDSPNGVILEYEVIYYGYKPVENSKVKQSAFFLCSASLFLKILFQDENEKLDVLDGPNTISLVLGRENFTHSLNVLGLVPGYQYDFKVTLILLCTS